MTIHARTFWGAFVAAVGFMTGFTETILSIYFHRPVIASVIFVSMVFAFVGGYIMYPKFTDGLARSFRENALPFVEVLRGGRRNTDPVVEVPVVEAKKKDESEGLG
jgi:hypothetical protein